MALEPGKPHLKHPYRVYGSRPNPISMPTNKVDREYVEWIRARRVADRTVEELAFTESMLLSDLYKAYSTPDSDDAFTRSQQANYEQSLLKQAVKLGAPKTIEFTSIPEGFQSYLLWLAGKYPKLNWEPVFQTYYREPNPPQRTGKHLTGEWNLSEEQELLLTLRVHADLIPAIGKSWNGRLLDSYDDDNYERIEALLESLKTMHDCNPVKAIEFNLPQLRERANYYTTHIDKLALHSLLFDPSADSFEDSELTNLPGFSMSDLLTVESYYEGEIERLTGKPYVVSIDPMTGMKPVNSIAFDGFEDSQTLDLEKDTNQSTPPVNEEPPKAIANSGENPGNTITFGGSEDFQTPDHEKDTKQSIPEVNAKASKAIEKPILDGGMLWDSKQEVFTTAEAAAILKVSAKTLRKKIKSNEIRAIKMGSGFRIQRGELTRAIEQPFKDRLDTGNDDYDPESGF
ncbi:helix-turn-helix domain-containing protein [Glutamicibacter ardleyensis]|uniref:helix-turn-helix domain-containing protein n=1 Tax=Glutamicibacter ardleyensis TaxID=225894 RepID=UPI003FD2D260